MNFLNNPPSGNWLHDIAVAAKPSLEELLADAQVVFRCLADYRSTHELSAADKDGKLTAEFWKCRERLNKKLAKLIRAPQVDLEEVFDGTRISWVSMIKDTEEPTTALLSQQIQWVVQLIAQGAILNVRRCKNAQNGISPDSHTKNFVPAHVEANILQKLRILGRNGVITCAITIAVRNQKILNRKAVNTKPNNLFTVQSMHRRGCG